MATAFKNMQEFGMGDKGQDEQEDLWSAQPTPIPSRTFIWEGTAPPPLCHPDTDHQTSSKIVSWAPRAFISDVIGYSGCKGLSSLEHVKIDWNVWTKASTVQWLPQRQVSSCGILPSFASYFFPQSLGKECVFSRHRNAQLLACKFK